MLIHIHSHFWIRNKKACTKSFLLTKDDGVRNYCFGITVQNKVMYVRKKIIFSERNGNWATQDSKDARKNYKIGRSANRECINLIILEILYEKEMDDEYNTSENDNRKREMDENDFSGNAINTLCLWKSNAILKERWMSMIILDNNTIQID